MTKEIKQIIAAYEEAKEQQQRVALATVVHVEGSSYRSPGARMLITEAGLLTGAISGGCLEGDALRKALMAIVQEKSLLVTYDTSDEHDAVIGVQLGCNGIIRVLIEPVFFTDADNPIELLKRAVEGRSRSLVFTFFSLADSRAEHAGTCGLLREDGTVVEHGKITLDWAELKREARSVWEQRRSILKPTANWEKGDSMLMEYLDRPISLVVGGAGNDVLPLVELARVLGWELTLIDGRPRYANERRFPNCQIIVSNPEDGLKQVRLDERTAVILMSHHYLYDKALLWEALRHPVPYVGMLGPKTKWERMWKELDQEGRGLDEWHMDRVFSPIGLDLGGEGAEEIAFSIIAEIKMIFAERSGLSLRTLAGSIHQRISG